MDGTSGDGVTFHVDDDGYSCVIVNGTLVKVAVSRTLDEIRAGMSVKYKHICRKGHHDANCKLAHGNMLGSEPSRMKWCVFGAVADCDDPNCRHNHHLSRAEFVIWRLNDKEWRFNNHQLIGAFNRKTLHRVIWGTTHNKYRLESSGEQPAIFAGSVKRRFTTVLYKHSAQYNCFANRTWIRETGPNRTWVQPKKKPKL